jgi:integrase
VRGRLSPGRHWDGGGLGLHLVVRANGGRQWAQRLAIAGKVRHLGLGSPPLVTLAEARERAADNARRARAGGDPLAEKRRARAATRAALTFAEAAERYLAAKAAQFRNEKHAKQWRATLDAYALPVIGAQPLEAVEMRDVLRVLEPIWTIKTETASRLRGRIEAVLAWATVAGHRAGDNPARWKGNLAEMLPKPATVAAKAHHPALALEDAARWWAALGAREGMGALALRFAAMTGGRSGEVRGMTWGEVQLGDRPRWTVPAARMKAKREHVVPLTLGTVALLEGLPRLDGSPFVFFAPRGGALSDMTLSAVMRRMHEADATAGGPGYLDPRSKRPAVPHGLRSTFRQWAAERGYEWDMAELQLAHRVGDSAARAYQRAEMQDRRRAMLSEWEGFLRDETPAGNLVPMREASRS